MDEKKQQILSRVYWVYVALLIFGLLIFLYVLKIQFYEGKNWREIAKKQTIHYDTIFAVRGNICSDDGTFLATSIPVFDLFWDSQVIQKDSTFNKYISPLADSLSLLFPEKSQKWYKNELIKARNNHKRNVLIKRKINFTQLKRLQGFPIFGWSKNVGGLIVYQNTMRDYPFKSLAYRTIGWDKDGDNNDVGLEGSYSKILSGENGKRLVERMADASYRPVNGANQIDAQNGEDIITTININFQDVAQNALLSCLDTNQADWGCAILMEVQTGYIKAIANLGRNSDGSYTDKFNYALGLRTDPGSTFKLASVIAVLEDGRYDTNTIVNTGIKSFDGKSPVVDSHEKGYGNVSVARAFELSSNVGIADIVYKAFGSNRKKFRRQLSKMRIDKPLGVEINGEPSPSFVDPKNNLDRMAYGYGVEMTPLQILTMYNAIANNGVMVKPMFVKEIRNSGKTEKIILPTVLNPAICSPATIKKVKRLMEGVVTRGTAKILQNSIFKIAGKTGTAKIFNSAGKNYDVDSYNASFVGYFPADNPKYTCIVVISNPKKGRYYGATISAPVFKEIADRVYASNIKIQQSTTKLFSGNFFPPVSNGSSHDLEMVYKAINYKVIKAQDLSFWASASNNSNFITMTDKRIVKNLVPDVTGMGIKDALFILENMGLKVKISGRGLVKNQSLEAGSKVEKGNVIILNLGT